MFVLCILKANRLLRLGCVCVRTMIAWEVFTVKVTGTGWVFLRVMFSKAIVLGFSEGFYVRNVSTRKVIG